MSLHQIQQEHQVSNQPWLLELLIKLWLVVSTPLKNMSSSVGIILPNMMGKIKFMFQTTNQ
jgi:hypothetical protein